MENSDVVFDPRTLHDAGGECRSKRQGCARVRKGLPCGNRYNPVQPSFVDSQHSHSCSTPSRPSTKAYPSGAVEQANVAVPSVWASYSKNRTKEIKAMERAGKEEEGD